MRVHKQPLAFLPIRAQIIAIIAHIATTKVSVAILAIGFFSISQGFFLTIKRKVTVFVNVEMAKITHLKHLLDDISLYINYKIHDN